MPQYQPSHQSTDAVEQIRLKPLKIKHRKGKGLPTAAAATVVTLAIATAATLYRQPQPKPAPQPQPISSPAPMAIEPTPPVISVPPLEMPIATPANPDELITVNAKPPIKTAKKTLKPQPQNYHAISHRSVQNPTPQAKQAKRIGTLVNTAAATSIAVPGALVIGASAVANPVKLTTVGDAGTGAIAGNFTQKAIAAATKPLPGLGNSGNPPGIGDSSGGGGGDSGNEPDGEAGAIEGDTPPCCTTGCQD